MWEHMAISFHTSTWVLFTSGMVPVYWYHFRCASYLGLWNLAPVRIATRMMVRLSDSIVPFWTCWPPLQKIILALGSITCGKYALHTSRVYTPRLGSPLSICSLGDRLSYLWTLSSQPKRVWSNLSILFISRSPGGCIWAWSEVHGNAVATSEWALR